MFLAELDGSRVRPAPAAPSRSGTVTHGGGEGRAGGSRTDRRHKGGANGRPAKARIPAVFADVQLPRVEATIGLLVEDRGSVGAVVELTEEAAILSMGAVRLRVSFGSDVRIDGHSVTLVGPGQGTTAGSEAEKALRTWRSEMASHDAVPAYVILKDAELVGIAARDPSTLAELAKCRGIGQIRLERWGDEILAVLEAARSAEP